MLETIFLEYYRSGQRGIIEGGRNPEVLVKVHIFWEGHKNVMKSQNFFDTTGNFNLFWRFY